jgi:uncharacterized tellurite resistance protein B-like protein
MRWTLVVAALGLAAVLGLAGCGSGSGSTSGGGQSAVAPNEAAGGKGFNAQNQKPADADAAAGGAGAASQGQPASVDQREVVRTAQISVEVDDVYRAAGKAREIAARFHGFVSDEKAGDDSATVELRVEADQLDAALTALAELGPKVLGRGQQAQDVTDQVVDVKARLDSQRASVERVRALLGKATTIGEIVQIESELTRRQADLESLERRSAALANQVELATVSATLSKPGTTIADRADGTGFLDGLSAGWRVFLASAQVLLTILGALLPFLIALAIPAAVIVLVRRRRAPAPSPPPAA